MKLLDSILSLLFCGIVLFSGVQAAHSQAPDFNLVDRESPVVVELFTSQGCHSCPPADQFLGHLVKDDPQVIALACHVTYWNYIGWKDTFSSSFCDNRQRDYKRSLKKHTAYTPQMVVNGRYEGIGSQRRQINALIGQAKHTPSVLPLGLSLTNRGIHIDVPDTLDLENTDALLLGVGHEQKVKINRGENWGKTLSYHNPVLSDQSLGQLNSGTNLVPDSFSNLSAMPRWVALIQDRSSGHILAAGQYLNWEK